MSEVECTEERHKAVNLHAVEVLRSLLKDLEDKHGDEQHETKFVGDLYARMIVSVYLGFNPQEMAKDAEAGAIRLMEMKTVEYEDDQSNT